MEEMSVKNASNRKRSVPAWMKEARGTPKKISSTLRQKKKPVYVLSIKELVLQAKEVLGDEADLYVKHDTEMDKDSTVKESVNRKPKSKRSSAVNKKLCVQKTSLESETNQSEITKPQPCSLESETNQSEITKPQPSTRQLSVQTSSVDESVVEALIGDEVVKPAPKHRRSEVEDTNDTNFIQTLQAAESLTRHSKNLKTPRKHQKSDAQTCEEDWSFLDDSNLNI